MLPMLATKGDHVPAGPGWVARGEVGRHAGAGRPYAAPACGCGRATRTTSPSPSPSCTAWPRSAARLPARRRGRRAGGGRARPSARWPTGCTCATPPARCGSPRRNPVTLIAFDLLRLDGEDLRDRPLVGATRAAAEALGLDDGRLAGAPDVRRRADAARRRRAAGARGHRQQAAVLALPPRAAQQGLAEVPDPADRRPSSSAGSATRPAATTGSGPCSSASRPPTGCSSAVGSAAASPARRAGCSPSCSTPLRRRRLAVRRGAAAARPAGHGLGRAACWWSTCSTSGSPPTAGCGSRRTAASAPT